MVKPLRIFILLFTVFAGGAAAQAPYLELLPGSVSTQVKAQANDSLSLFYKVVYHGTGPDSAFTGEVRTWYYTNKNKVPSVASDVFNTADQIPPLPIYNLDTFRIFCHLKVDPSYFSNGRSNLVVIWPTGNKQSNKAVVLCQDTFTYATRVAITGLSGIDGGTDEPDIFSIFPNPANTFLNLQINDPTIEVKNINIINANGKTVRSLPGDVQKIDLAGLSEGLYILDVNCKDGEEARYSFVVRR